MQSSQPFCASPCSKGHSTSLPIHTQLSHQVIVSKEMQFPTPTLIINQHSSEHVSVVRITQDLVGTYKGTVHMIGHTMVTNIELGLDEKEKIQG